LSRGFTKNSKNIEKSFEAAAARARRGLLAASRDYLEEAGTLGTVAGGTA
jgi:hypothetical protein